MLQDVETFKIPPQDKRDVTKGGTWRDRAKMKHLPKEASTKNTKTQRSILPLPFLWILNWEPSASSKCSPKQPDNPGPPGDMDSNLQVGNLPEGVMKKFLT